MVYSEQEFLQSNARRLSAAGVESPYFEVQLLMALAVKVDRIKIIAGIGRPFTDQEIGTFLSHIDRRCKREPLAYIRGSQEFYGLDFKVSSATLIPRPETEILVEFAIKKAAKFPDCTVIDVGTGTGCIAISVAVNVPNANVIGIDKSLEAVSVARENVKKLSPKIDGKVMVVQSDMLSAILSNSVDILLSNPPYIPTKEIRDLEPEISRYEPKLALDGGKDGFDFHKQLIKESKRVLKPGGWLAVEVALGQAESLQKLYEKADFVNTKRLKDLSGIDRVVVGQLKDDQ